MIIAIDARSLEQPTTGVGRYLSNVLKRWKDHPEHEFLLYFKNRIPQEEYLKSSNFRPKLLGSAFGFSSNFFFQHVLIPINIKKDRVDFFFSPFYLKPFYCPARSSVALHDISYEAHPEWFDSRSQFILRMMSKYSAKSTDLIFTISEFSKNEIIKYYGTSPEKIKVTYLACDEGFEKKDRSASEMGEKPGKYKIEGKYILYIGSIFTRRHVPELIRAFGKISEELNDYQLVVLGKNHTYPFEDIDGQAADINKKLGRNAILHIDSVAEEELNYLYGGCEFVIYLSDYEGFGLPVVEAQKFDKPVVTTRGSSLPEAGGNSVEYVGHNTEKEIYDSMKRLILDGPYREKLVLLGRENLKRFSWQRCADEILRNIESIKKRG
ncbi:MAG: glycosyltransferase family 1 protein [Candidatus Paceibacterota bacterium]|jgi:glycosyltransferase involved in cell wall biosynthesis